MAAKMLLLFGILITAASTNAATNPPEVEYEICTPVYNLFANSPYRILSSSASDSKPGQYPFAVSFQRKSTKNVHICGGALVEIDGEQSVLTSAQCGQIFQECNNDDIEAVFGAWNLTDPIEMKEHQQRIVIGKISLNSKFSSRPPPYLRHDSAHISLTRRASYNARVQPLRPFLSIPSMTSNLKTRLNYRDVFLKPGVISNDLLPSESKCRVISWGNRRLNEENKEIATSVLQQENVRIIENEECNKTVGTINPVHDEMICAYRLPTSDVGDCEDAHSIWKPVGDTGSALICDQSHSGSVIGTFLVGTTSWGNLPCKSRPYSSIMVFSNVPKLLYAIL